MITLPGQLAIKTIHGRNGDFNVGRLTTSIGEFVTKNAELDQYREGKYEGEFIITKIYSKSWSTGSHIGIDTRADLGGMTLSNLDALTKDEAHRLSPQEVDPIDEEAAKPQPVTAAPSEPIPVVTPPSPDPLVDTTPFGDEPPSNSPAESEGATQADAALFGAVWPLGQIVKLDPTVDRRLLRKQRDRLDALGYDFDYASQNWNLKAA
jgi:hypothetical protein